MQSAQEAPAASDDRLIRLPEVIAVTGLSRSLVYELEAGGKFPKRCALTERTSAWVWSEVQAWVRNRIAQREADAKARAEVGRRLVESRSAAPE